MGPRPAGRMISAPEEWDRRKLQVLLGVAWSSSAVAVGVIWSVVGLLPDGAGLRRRSRRVRADSSAVGPASRRGGRPAGPALDRQRRHDPLPQPRSLGAAQVATGFPRTAEGAFAQLIAIDQRAIQSASVVTAQAVIEAWAAPGGPTAESWSGVEAVRALLSRPDSRQRYDRTRRRAAARRWG